MIINFQNSWEKEAPTTFQREGVGASHKRCGITVASDFSIWCTGIQKIVKQPKFLRKMSSTLEFYIQLDLKLLSIMVGQKMFRLKRTKKKKLFPMHHFLRSH